MSDSISTPNGGEYKEGCVLVLWKKKSNLRVLETMIGPLSLHISSRGRSHVTIQVPVGEERYWVDSFNEMPITIEAMLISTTSLHDSGVV